jgi:hypothetical protein
MNNHNSITSSPGQYNNTEKYNKHMMNKTMIPVIPMLALNNIAIGSMATVVPWIILLIIVSFIILI